MAIERALANLPVETEEPSNEILGEIEVDLVEEGSEEEFEELSVDIPHFENLVGYLDKSVLDAIGQEVIEGFNADEASRKEWEETIDSGLKNLGIKIEEVSDPFEGACGAHHPLILESSIKFQSKASLELFPPAGPVKTQIVGVETEEKQKKARRVKNYINYYITEKMPEYYLDGEKILFSAALMGTVFRKIWYDPSKDRPVSEFVTYKNFIISDSAKSLEDQERYTHKMEVSANELIRAFANGEYIEPEEDIVPDSEDDSLGTLSEVKGFIRPQDDRNQTYTLLEQHVNLNLPEPFNNPFDIADPYVVTVDKASGKVLSIRRNWEEGAGELSRQKLTWFVPWHFVPSMGFHALGYIHLLGNLQITLTTVLRSLVDSGQFANLQGGFKLKGVKIGGSDVEPIAPGEFRDVEATVDDLNKAIKSLPFKEPSTVLYNMLNFIEARSQKFADSTEQVVNEATNYGPVGTTMALLEASTKFYSAIHKRLHASQRQELKIIARILKNNVRNTQYDYEEDGDFEEDFDSSVVDILPVSDPNIPTAAHRMMIANAALDIALKAPDMANKREAVRSALFAMGNIDVDKIIPPEEEVLPSDPVTDIEKAVSGKPIKAFPGQDHQSHIQIKTFWLQDPLNGGSPLMQAAAPAVVANIKEHMMLAYRESLAGVVANLSEEEVANIPTEDFVIATAAEKVANLNQALQKQMEGDDPMEKVAEAEMLKAKTGAESLEHKKIIDYAEAALDAQRLALDTVKEQNRAAEKSKELQSAIRNSDMGRGKDLIKIAIENLNRRAVDSNSKKK